MSSSPATRQANPPHASTAPLHAASPQPKGRDLKSWWRGFKLPSRHHTQDKPQGIFGIPLRESITYANVAISLIDEKGQSYIYGYVPIVVAKCGVFLKETATGIEGIFRLSGSEKRIKELQTIFDSPDKYGKGLVWDGYNAHDAATVLRRYLNDLPEPVVPLDLYEKFRDPLRGATTQAVGDVEGPQFVENFDERGAIRKYQDLITQLPPLHRQLLLYILDLLAVFAAKADENRMTSQNLAAIFQPGMLSHPSHAMIPAEYRLNQCVLIFLIENQDHFLIGMQGTAADERTRQEVETGSGLATPNRKSGLARSASDASAGADSVRREGQIRRNRSVSSRHSKGEGNTTPNSPATAATPTGTGGLGRSNTVPSKKSPALAGAKFRRHEASGPHSPSHLEPLTQASPTGKSPRIGLSSASQSAAAGTTNMTEGVATTAGPSQERLLEVPQEVSTPPKERGLPTLFQRSPADNIERRQPNKLKKKRIPGSLNPSAQSSNTSLSQPPSNAASPSAERGNPMDHLQPIPTPDALNQALRSQQKAPTSEPQPRQEPQQAVASSQEQPDESALHTPRASQIPQHNTLHPEQTLKGNKSPPHSLHSSFNENSDMDQAVDDQQLATQAEQPEKDKKRRWRLSKSKKEEIFGPASPPRVEAHRSALGSNDKADVSTSSIGSATQKQPKSALGSEADESAPQTADTQTAPDAGKDKDDPKGPIGWIRNKYREAKENAEQRRTKSPPPAEKPGQSTTMRPQGKSPEAKSDQAVADPLTTTDKEAENVPIKVDDEASKPREELEKATAAEPSTQPVSDARVKTQTETQGEAPVEAPAPVSTAESTQVETTSEPQQPSEPTKTQ